MASQQTPPNQPAFVNSQIFTALIAGGVSLLITVLGLVWNPLTQRRIERLKAQLQSEIGETSARRDYEYEARKRLYAEVEPLLFQLFEAAERSYYRVVSLVRMERDGKLGDHDRSALQEEGYYSRTTVYELFLPLVLFRLLQKVTTFVDLRYDSSARMKYYLLKLSYYAFTDHYVMAKLPPEVPYDPDVEGWEQRRVASPTEHWRQGLVLGLIDRLLDSCTVVDGAVRRPMSYGEFEDSVKAQDSKLREVFIDVQDIFIKFSFRSRPILARILLAHATLMLILMRTYTRRRELKDMIRQVPTTMEQPRQRQQLRWWGDTEGDMFAPVSNYLQCHLGWIYRWDKAASSNEASRL